MPTRERVLTLLRGTEASRIRFKVPLTTGAITINLATFATVASVGGGGLLCRRCAVLPHDRAEAARWSNEPHKTAKAWPTVC